MTKYSYSHWQDRTGTIPCFWRPEHFEDSGWHMLQKQGGYNTDPVNHEIYGKNIGVLVPTSVDPVFQRLHDFFDLDEMVYDLSRYRPGMILPWHEDSYPTYSRNKKVTDIQQIVRIIVLLHDSQPGHQLWIGDRFCYGQAGRWWSWQGTRRHMAANLGEQDRSVIQITGLKHV